ncbi:MAG TPA: NAD(P)-dependent oxidoreductase [Caulobacteraceae bacterium]|jgi:nucleoside-diphosphate-sugar epimerase
MKALVTGAAGHLGEALALRLTDRGDEVVGLDRLTSPQVNFVGEIGDEDFIDRAMVGVEIVFHAATLHKPHVATHSRQAFIDTNITGTNILLNAAQRAGVRAFVFTSTTSVFGEAMATVDCAPSVWVDESLSPRPRNIYGLTKLASEGLCTLAQRETDLATICLRTARFFPEEDDDPQIATAFAVDNVKLNEFLYRRADIEDVTEAHLLAAEHAAMAGPGPFVVSSTTPFSREDLAELGAHAPAVLARRVPEYVAVYERLGWRMFPAIGRVYDNAAARRALGWTPKHDYCSMLAQVSDGRPPASDLARAVGEKGYHRKGRLPDAPSRHETARAIC